MTRFPENLAILRKRAGYTQETLAEALGVSRQAVGKWESGQGLPEAATLLDLADLLGCTLDQLMRENLTDTALEAVPTEDPVPGEDPARDWSVISGHMARFALQIALGVVLVLLGVSMTVALSALLGESGLVALPLLLFVAAAVFLFVFGGIDHGSFEKTYPILPPCPYPEEEAAFDAKFRIGMAAAVAGVLVSVALLATVAVLFESSEVIVTLAAAGFLALLSGCVGTMVWLGILHSLYHPEPKPTHGRDVSGAIMLTATALFLLLGFTRNLWHPAWIVFPLGGILCGIVNSLRKDS